MQYPQSRIQLLSPLVAERIAAGEVIERPASVVKELVENSLDAGATQIEVHLVNGGCDEIQVVDNGVGMSSSDLETCLLRHATSKISKLEDLESLASLGFRGEALPSVASVAKVEIQSKEKNQDQHFKVVAHFQAPKKGISELAQSRLYCGSPHGTAVTVRSLFSEIPVRLKFLKSPSAETSAVREVLERIAGAHPHVGFTFTNDGKKILSFLPTDRIQRVAQLLNDRNEATAIGECKSSKKSFGNSSVEVIWLTGASLPHMRKVLQFVNGRALRDKLIQQAVMQPLRQSFLPGNFPAIAVFLDLPGTEIDVNAHPTKSEIRFRDTKTLFALIAAAITELNDKVRTYTWSGNSSAMDVGESSPRNWMHNSPPLDIPSNFDQGGFAADTTNPASDFQSGFLTKNLFPDSGAPQFLGIWFQTYFVFHKDEKIILVDQHAAHERIRYEKLKARALKHASSESQSLFIPEIIALGDTDPALWVEKIKALNSLGFEAELFSDTKLIFRSIPVFWGQDQLKSRLENLVRNLAETEIKTDGSTVLLDESMFEKIAMQACRSSVKAGDRVSPPVAEKIFQDLLACEHPGNCPHGRPTMIEISESRVEKWFGRTVP